MKYPGKTSTAYNLINAAKLSEQAGPILVGGSGGGRVFYLDLLRLLATLAVVYLHANSRFIGTLSMSQDGWWFVLLASSAVRWAVPVFLMISGALILADRRPFDIASFYLKRIRYVMIPFIVWSVIYNFLKLKNGIFFTKTVSVEAVLVDIFYGPAHGHLWFVYVLLGCYLVSPVIKAFIEINSSSSNSLYIICVALFFCIYPPIEGALFKASLFTPLPNHFYSFGDFIFYFIFGYFLHSTSSQRRRLSLLMFGAGLVITVVGTYTVVKQNGGFYDHSNYFFKGNSINVMLMATGFFLFIKYAGEGLSACKSEYGNLLSFIQKLSLYGYGVYMMHPYVLDIIFFKLPTNIRPLALNPLIGVHLAFFLCLLISYAFCVVVSRVKFLDVLLIGSRK